MQLSFTILGDIPSKKNSKVRTGKKLVSSQAYRTRHSKQMYLWMANKAKLGNETLSQFPIQLTEKIVIKTYSETLRKFDLTNKAESVMDFLVDVGILADDNVRVCPKIELEYLGKDKEHARTMIDVYFPGKNVKKE